MRKIFISYEGFTKKPLKLFKLLATEAFKDQPIGINTLPGECSEPYQGNYVIMTNDHYLKLESRLKEDSYHD